MTEQHSPQADAAYPWAPATDPDPVPTYRLRTAFDAGREDGYRFALAEWSQIAATIDRDSLRALIELTIKQAKNDAISDLSRQIADAILASGTIEDKREVQAEQRELDAQVAGRWAYSALAAEIRAGQ